MVEIGHYREFNPDAVVEIKKEMRIKPNHLEVLILRQVRGGNYELKGGECKVQLQDFQ